MLYTGVIAERTVKHWWLGMGEDLHSVHVRGIVIHITRDMLVNLSIILWAILIILPIMLTGFYENNAYSIHDFTNDHNMLLIKWLLSFNMQQKVTYSNICNQKH